MVLLIGHKDDPCLRIVMDSLDSEETAALFVEECSLLEAFGLAWRPGAPPEASYISIDGRRIPLSALTGVMARAWRAHTTDPLLTEKDQAYAGFEMIASLAGILREINCPVINRPCLGMSYSPAFSDSRVMRAVHASGFTLPRTLVSTGREAGLDFYAGCGERAILGAPANHFARRWLEGPRGASELESLPDGQAFYIQSAGEGRWLEVFVVGDHAFAADSPVPLPGAPGTPDRLSPAYGAVEVEEQCCRLAARVGLEFAQIHVCLDGPNAVFYDLNPYPRPWQCEEAMEASIAECLVSLLRQARPKTVSELVLSI